MTSFLAFKNWKIPCKAFRFFKMTYQSFSCSLCFSATWPPYQSSLTHQKCFNPCFTTLLYSYSSYPHNFLLHLLQGSQILCSQWHHPWSSSPKLYSPIPYTYTHIILLPLHLHSWALVTSLYILLIMLGASLLLSS